MDMDKPEFRQELQEKRKKNTFDTVPVVAHAWSFKKNINPEELCQTVRSIHDPWNLFATVTELSENTENDYWKIKGVLFHIENSKMTGTTKLTCEISSTMLRVYFTEDTNLTRLHEFLQVVNDHYPLEKYRNSQK